MIIMWLGSFVFAVVALTFLRRTLAQGGAGLQTRFLNLPEPSSLIKIMISAKLCSVSCAGFLETQYSAVALLSSRAFPRRYAVLLLCLSVAGLWPTMVGVLLAWQLGGEIFFVLALLCFFLTRWWQGPRVGFKILMALGAFLTGMQWLLQKQSILMSILGESSVHFLLADGRFPAQILWLVLSFIMTLVIAVESWAVLLALVLVVAGSLSLNGAVGMIIGELLAHVWMLWWRSRKLNQDARLLVKHYALASTLGLVVAFFGAGFLRQFFAWGLNIEGSVLTEKSWQLFSLYFLIAATQGLATLIWGHFAVQMKVDEVQTGEYFPARWVSSGLVAPRVFEFVVKKLRLRLELLLAQNKELNAKDRAQIPANFLREHELEIAQLTQWLK